MKKWILFSRFSALIMSLLVFTPSAQAQNESVFDGFYTNLSLGAVQRNGKGTWANTSTADFEAFPGLTPFVGTISFDLEHNSPLIALSLGQGYSSYGNFYGGWEAYISHSKYKRHSPLFGHSFEELGTNATKTNTILSSLNYTEVGFDLKPGLIYSDTLLYGRVGVAYNKMTLQSSPAFTFNFQALSAFPSVMTIHEHVKKKASLRLGVGLEQHLGNCFSIRLDYAFTYYGKVTVASNRVNVLLQEGSTNFAWTSDSTQIKLMSNAISLGLSYWW